MWRLRLFCIGIPIKILLIGITLSVAVYFVFDAFVVRTNPEYDSFFAWYMYVLFTFSSCIVCAVLSVSSFSLLSRNLKQVEDTYFSIFFTPIAFTLFPVTLGFIGISNVYFLYLLVPLALALLQLYHYKKYKRNMQKGKYIINKTDENN